MRCTRLTLAIHGLALALLVGVPAGCDWEQEEEEPADVSFATLKPTYLHLQPGAEADLSGHVAALFHREGRYSVTGG